VTRQANTKLDDGLTIGIIPASVIPPLPGVLPADFDFVTPADIEEVTTDHGIYCGSWWF
jgi:hypothetical protein